MGKEEDSLLMFLSMEKSQDLESCCDEKLKQGIEQQAVEVQRGVEEESVGSSFSRFWICFAASLLVLSLVSGVLQFMPAKTSEYVTHITSVYIGDGHLETFAAESRFSDRFGFLDEYQGEAIAHDGRAYLTSQPSADKKGVVAKPHSVGRLLHSEVFQMKHQKPELGEESASSFRATFVFSIEKSLAGREATGDGFAFVIVPEGNGIGSAGGNLGVTDLDQGEASHTLAIEFDTWKNPSLHDISNNHVGINVNSMVSLVAEEAGYWTPQGHERRGHEFRSLDLTSGKIQAWIDYDSLSQELSVRISPILGVQPYKPLLRTKLDLSKVFNKYMSVGFSAATGDFAAKHIIHSWHFEESNTLQHWESVNIVHPDSEVYQKPPQDQSLRGLRVGHVGNLPVFRNPHALREYDMSMRSAATEMVIAASGKVESKPLKPIMRKRCVDYIPKFPSMDFATFEEHFVVNSLWLLLGLATGLVAIHLLFIAYHIVFGCFYTCQDHNDEAMMKEYCRVMDQSEKESEGRYVLVVSDSQQHQQQAQSENGPLNRV